MKASYKVDINSMKKTGSVFFDDANIKDQSGSVTLTEDLKMFFSFFQLDFFGEVFSLQLFER